LGAHRMSASLGTILIWVSWLYVVVAIFSAKRTYRKARQSHPAYFGSPEKAHRDPLNLEEARGVFELITDSAIESKGFDASIIKMVRTIRVLYFTAPIAFFIFVIGIAIS
jgi:hypothetical protein